jgi:hypothetical protein
MKPVGKPDAGNPHVRFDERGGETGRAYDTAPLLDSTDKNTCLLSDGCPELGPLSGQSSNSHALKAHSWTDRIRALKRSLFGVASGLFNALN